MCPKTTTIALWLVGTVLLLTVSCFSENSPTVQPQSAPPTRIPTNAQLSGKSTPSPEVDTSPSTSPSTEPLTPTATVGPMAIPTPSQSPYALHKVQAGHTLGWIAANYDTSMDALITLNKLSGPDAIIQIGQQLRVPLAADIPQAPTDVVWPDSEVVYSPAYVDFDVATFLTEQGGYLANYSEPVDGAELSGAQVIERVAERFSIGPRVLLTILEHYGGWVTNPTPTETALQSPAGRRNPHSRLYLMLGWTARKINAGYYGYKRDGFWIYRLADYNLALTSQGLNAGTVGMQNILAVHSDLETWEQAITDDGLMATYRQLFGDAADYELEGFVIPSNLTQPPLSLPWQEGQGFYFTAGPHIAYIAGSGWAAIDFGPPDVLGSCYYSNEPNTAVADGTILVARRGEIQLDIDGDGNIQTGWVILYLHMALDVDTPVQVGQHVEQGDTIGYASCEGGEANASHLHIARRYNGEWMDAGGPVPFELSGWVVQPSFTPYDGVMKKDKTTRASCECWTKKNLIVNGD